MSLPPFKVLRPRSVEEAVAFLDAHAPNVQVIAGGTDLIPSLRQRLFAPEFVVDLRGVHELRGIRTIGPEAEIGAATPLTTVENSDYIRRNFAVLHEAVATVASPLLRNMGTLGGNICLDTRCLWYNQSPAWRLSCGFCIKSPRRANIGLAGDPEIPDGDLCHVAPGGKGCWAAFSGDTPPALLCLGAELEIASVSGWRRVALRDFYTNVGDARMKLEKNELLTRIFLPQATAGWRGVYRKLRIRGSIDYPLAGVAVAVKLGNGAGSAVNAKVLDARVAITGVNPAPLLVPGVEQAMAGRAIDEAVAAAVSELAAKMAKPLTTSALTPEYRREMIRVFTARAVLAAAEFDERS